MDLGIYFTKTEPPKGLKVPGTIKVDIPGITWKGFTVLHTPWFCIYMATEV